MTKAKRLVGDAPLKEAEWKLVSELMKNSRRSDRELARVVGVSQPTVSRLIGKLEKEGYIREYTMIPDFNKLGYSLLSLTLVKLRKELKPQELEEARKIVMEDMKEAPQEIVCFERGIGHGCDGVIVSFHEDYSSYIRLKERIRDYPIVEFSETESFLINLDDKIHYRYLTLATLAQHILALKKRNDE